MEQLLSKIENYNSYVEKKEGELKILKKQKIETLEEIELIDGKIEDIITEKVLLENSSLKALNLSKEIMEEVTTNSLQSVFNDDSTISINLGSKSGQRTAELLLMQGETDTDPGTEEAGGVADMVAVTTFLSLGDLLADNNAPVFLDEPNKYLSKEFSERMALYLKEIIDYTGNQMFLVTHDEHLKTVGDISFKMTKIDKTSYMEVVEKAKEGN